VNISPPYRFVLRALLWALPIGLLLVAFESSLWRAGETTPIGRVCRALEERPDALFGRQFFDQALYRFKWVFLSRQDPETLALGTSRVMQFRREMFRDRSATFFNAGGMIQNLRDLEEFVAALPPSTRLSCVILGVEFSWFNERAAAEMENFQRFSRSIRYDAGFDGVAHGQVFQQVLRNGWMSDGPGPSWSVLAGAWRGGGATDMDAWGFMARNRCMGFRSDGSFDYGLPAPADWTFKDREQPPVLERIRNGTHGFKPVSSLSESRVEQFLGCLKALKARQISVLCFAPPYSSGVVAALEADPGLQNAWRQYRLELPSRIRAAGAAYVDASSPAMLGMDDRCMRDGLHAMETFHVRLLAALAADPNAAGAKIDVARAFWPAVALSANPWFPIYGGVP